MRTWISSSVLVIALVGAPDVHQIDFTDGSGNFEFVPSGRAGDRRKVTATHFVFEYKPVSANVTVQRRVFTLELPPGVPPGLPPVTPGLPRRR